MEAAESLMISYGIPVWIDFGIPGRITEGDISDVLKGVARGRIKINLELMGK